MLTLTCTNNVFICLEEYLIILNYSDPDGLRAFPLRSLGETLAATAQRTLNHATVHCVQPQIFGGILCLLSRQYSVRPSQSENKHRDRDVVTSLVLAPKRSHCEKGSRVAIVSVLRPKTVCNKILIKFSLSEILGSPSSSVTVAAIFVS